MNPHTNILIPVPILCNTASVEINLNEKKKPRSPENKINNSTFPVYATKVHLLKGNHYNEND